MTGRNKNGRRNFLKLLGSAAVMAVAPISLKAAQRKKPNIILMMADDLGIGEVAAYGFNDKIKTPHLDEMAAAGLRFDRFYSQAPVCSPTRGSCLTARHAFRYGIFEANVGHLRKEEITLAEILSKFGYTCGHFGKWHLGAISDSPSGKEKRMAYSPPNANGFDEWFSVQQSVKTFDPYGPNAETAASTDYPYLHNGNRITENVTGDTSRIIMDRTIPFIEKAVKEDKPFFTVIWFNTPHAPIDADPKYEKIYNGIKQWKYYGAITDMDKQVGRLRTTLQKLRIANNTMLWFSSDNGPTGQGTAGPYYTGKRHLFEGGIRMPTMLEWPVKVASGRSTDIIGCSSDYFPTILETLGIKINDPRPVDGVSLMPLIENKMNSRPGYLCFQSHGTSVIMNQKYKAIKVRTGAFSQTAAEKRKFPLNKWLLFDMQNDFSETTDISNRNPQIIEKMSRIYAQWSNSCQNSFNGKDYQIDNYKPSGTYRDNAGLRTKSAKKNRKKTTEKTATNRSRVLSSRTFQIIVITLLISLPCTYANEYFVSTDGNNSNPGTLTKPWATIQHAVDTARPGDTVNIKGGHYHESVTITNLKGTAENPITFKNHNSEEVILAGTTPITSQWTQHNESIWKTTLTEDIWQLFVDGKAMTVARWPNVTLDYMDHIEAYSDTPPPGSYWDRRSPQSPTVSPDTGSTWGHIVTSTDRHNLAATGLNFTGAVMKSKKTKYSGTELVINHTAGSNEFDHTTVFYPDNAGMDMGTEGIIYLTCHINCLDAPREWYYDKDTRQLYVWFEDNASPAGRFIEGKTRTTVLQTNSAEHINFYGLTLFGGNFELYNSRFITFDECRFLYCGHFKDMLKEFSEHSVINRAQNGGGDLFWYNCEFAYSPGSSLYIRTWNNQIVENCWFHNSQWDQTTYGSVSDKKGYNTTIRRCTFNTMGASNATKNAGGSLMEYNHSYNFYFPGDSSGHQVPTGAQSTTVLHHIWIHDLYSRNGIRFDGDPAGTKCQVSRCVSTRNARGFRLKGDQHQIYNITALNNAPKSDINIAHMKFYGYQNPDTGEITNDPSFDWPKAMGRRGSLPYHGNENSIVKNIAGQIIDPWYGPQDKLIVTNPNNEAGIWHGQERNELLKEQLRDPDNLDFRPKENSDLIDAGFQVLTITDGYNGTAPDIGAYEYGNENYWIPGCRFKKASTPIPPNNSTTVKSNADLMWLQGRNALSSNVYFGTDPNAVATATTQSPQFKGNQTNNVFTPGKLESDTNYYWRIDTVTDTKVIKGDLWTFVASYTPLYTTVEPTDDTWIRTGQAWLTCNSSEMHIRMSNRYAFLKFDATEIEDQNYSRVILRIHAVDACNNTSIYAVPDTDWTECELTGESGGYPAPGQLLDKLTDIQADSWNDFDVTGHVTGLGVYAFRLSTTDDEKAWHSSESSYSPQLFFIPKQNHAPYFHAVSIHEPDAFVGIAYQGTIGDVVTDLDDDTLTITKVSAPQMDWLNISPDGTLSGTPGPEHFGSSQWTVRVEDGNGGFDEARMDIIVKESNDPDINGNGAVGIEDFAIIASQWMNHCGQPDWCKGADLNLSKRVDMKDLLITVNHWLVNKGLTN